MDALQSRYGGLSAIVAVFVALCAVIGWETGWGARVLPEPEAGAAPAPQPVPLALLPDYQIEGGIASRRDTIDRPAFVPTRRPAPPAVQEAQRPRMPRNQFTLTGTAVVDQKQIAFLRETAGGKARTVRAGETINGVVVAEVKPDRVKLVMGDESEELMLKLASGPKQTVQPAVPGPPGQPPAARPQVAGQQVAPDTGLPMDSDASILERRRAARAALQAQQEAAARAGGQATPVAPAMPGNVPAPPPAAATQPAAASPSSTDFSEIVRRRQQQRGR